MDETNSLIGLHATNYYYAVVLEDILAIFIYHFPIQF